MHGRSRAAVAAWVAFIVGLVAGGDVNSVASSAVGAAVGAVFVGLGYAAAWRCRTISPAATVHPARFAMVALAIGAAMGLVNLAANWAIASIDPALRKLLVERMTGLDLRVAVVSAPLVEEVTVRLFMMSVMAWLVSRVTQRPELVFAIALVASSVFFAVLHLARPVPLDAALTNYYRMAILVKYSLCAVPLGWLFWRRGLPYAILCHAAANAAHLAVQGVLF
jgi:hypothetical protein